MDFREACLASWTVLAVLCIAASAQAAQPPRTNGPSGGSADVTASSTDLSGLSVPALIQPADWIHKPSPTDLFKLVPGRIARSGKDFEVVLKCKVLATSMVEGCSVLSDTDPSGALGQAAMRASISFRIKPRSVNGTLSDNAWVRIPIGFNFNYARPASAASSPDRK